MATITAIVTIVVAATAAAEAPPITTIVVVATVSATGLSVEVTATATTTVVIISIIAITAVVAELLVLGRATILVAGLVMPTAHATAMASATTTWTVTSTDLLTVRWDHSWLVTSPNQIRDKTEFRVSIDIQNRRKRIDPSSSPNTDTYI